TDCAASKHSSEQKYRLLTEWRIAEPYSLISACAPPSPAHGCACPHLRLARAPPNANGGTRVFWDTSIGGRTGEGIDERHSHAYERVDSEFGCRGDGDLHRRACLGSSDFRSDPRPRLIAFKCA